MAFIETVDRELVFSLHPGQLRAMESERRFVLVLAGFQGGKTVFGPPWLYREIQRRGPGDYLVATPTFPLLSMKVLPEFMTLFKTLLHLGDYTGSPTRCFTFSADGAYRTFGHAPEVETKVFFGTASHPDSLESATVKAAWLDEAGQTGFRLGSWEAIQRRLAIHKGRALLTTTPYSLGWLKQQLHDPWLASGGDHPLIDVVRFDSTTNPAFPPEEFERLRASWPKWKFDMFCRAIFTRPAGMIYDCFDDAIHKVQRFPISDRWRRYLGLDFGGVHTAGIFFAEDPETRKLYAYREYLAGGRTAREHKESLLKGEPSIPFAVGGSKSEGQWRDEFGAAGLHVNAPAVTEVEVGIDRVYGAIKRGELYVFDDLRGLLDEIGSYSRSVDERGEPTQDIEAKETFHKLDAVRYIVSWVKRGSAEFKIGMSRKPCAVGLRGVFDGGDDDKGDW